MASASLAETRAYLGIDGDDHDTLIALFLSQAEIYVRRLSSVGDEVDDGGAYVAGYPDALQLAQLLVTKFYFDRREAPNDGKSPPGLYGYMGGYERDGEPVAAGALPGPKGDPGEPGRDSDIPPLEVRLDISNAQLKQLDTQYHELIPSPGFRQFIEVEQVWLLKSGNDRPPEHTEFYRIAVSPNPVLTEAEALEIDGRPNTFSEMPIPDWQTPHYFYAGTSATNQDVDAVNGIRFVSFDEIFERVPGTLTVDGLAIKWWRTRVPYATRNTLFDFGRTSTRLRRNFNQPIPDRIGSSNFLALLYSDNPVGDRPYSGGQYSSGIFWGWGSLLGVDGGTIFAQSVGGQGLREDQALLFGSIVAGTGIYYSAAVFDQYLADVDDVRLEMLVRYSIHSTLIDQG